MILRHCPNRGRNFDKGVRGGSKIFVHIFSKMQPQTLLFHQDEESLVTFLWTVAQYSVL